MPEANQDSILHRYPGVNPFSTSEKFLYFGRQSDIEALYTLIFIKQAVVLYGKSGYGKSSLINAGIIPKLKENNSWTHFSVRFNNFSGKEIEQNVSPAQTVKQRLSENIILNKNNILDELIPNENSFWYWIKQHQSQNTKANYIFFFDQFEELFSYPKEQVNEFSELLSELLYTTVPLKFKKKIAEANEDNLINNAQHEFLYEKPEIKVVFCIRSDRLSLLNGLADKHPSILQYCYELNALNIADARLAIVEPAALSKNTGFTTPKFSFSEKAIDTILKSVSDSQDGKIETATLQIVCRYVEDTLVATKKILLIDENNLGDITDIFQQYYQNILSRLSNDERIRVQHLIEDELIDGNRRNALMANYIQTRFDITDSLLRQLEKSTILRNERDASGRILIELSHDSLIKPIQKVKENRLNSELESRRRTELFQKRKQEEQIDFLHKVRAVKALEKKELTVKESARTQKIYSALSKELLKKENLNQTWRGLLMLAILFFCIVWSVIATFKYINRDKEIEVKQMRLDSLNKELENYVNTDKRFASDSALNAVLKKYKNLK